VKNKCGGMAHSAQENWVCGLRVQSKIPWLLGHSTWVTKLPTGTSYSVLSTTIGTTNQHFLNLPVLVPVSSPIAIDRRHHASPTSLATLIISHGDRIDPVEFPVSLFCISSYLAISIAMLVIFQRSLHLYSPLAGLSNRSGTLVNLGYLGYAQD
jgi:hypothetical protein